MNTHFKLRPYFVKMFFFLIFRITAAPFFYVFSKFNLRIESALRPEKLGSFFARRKRRNRHFRKLKSAVKTQARRRIESARKDGRASFGRTSPS